MYLAPAGKASVDKLGVASTRPPPRHGRMEDLLAYFPLITCHFLSLLGNVRELSRKIMASRGGWVKTL